MATKIAPPAEAELIRQGRETANPALSRRQAAAKAGISPTQWSDIERGHKTAGGGVIAPVQASAETLARMARVVSVSADDLADAGREDAADQLRALDREGTIRHRLAAIPGLGPIDAQALTRANGQELLPLIASGLDTIEQSDLSTAAKRDLTAVFVDNLIHDAVRRHSEMLLILRIATASSHPG
jgi:transcriptional regulator with XRE-family HTH domain